MTLVYIAGILLQAGIIVYFFLRGRKQKNNSNAIPPDDTYEGKRRRALSVTPSQLKLALPADSLYVYGVIMDWNMGDAVVTLAAYITGAAGMYLTSGGGVDGAGNDPAVGEAAVDLVVAAQDHIGRAVMTVAADIPADGCVRFYLLSNRGVYAAQEEVKYFDDSSSAWTGIFQKGNHVIAEMGKVVIKS